MASRIWLGKLKPEQKRMGVYFEPKWKHYTHRKKGELVIIAKGNIIEGIEAKE